MGNAELITKYTPTQFDLPKTMQLHYEPVETVSYVLGSGKDFHCQTLLQMSCC